MPQRLQACLPRSKENLLVVVHGLDVEENPAYLPGKGLTWCNKYLRDLLHALSPPFPKADWFAHQQIDYLASEVGKRAGWNECKGAEGQSYANEGKPVVVTYRNAKTPPAGHSHVALLVPTASPNKIFITQAGKKNYLRAELVKGFGSLPVRFFWHE